MNLDQFQILIGLLITIFTMFFGTIIWFLRRGPDSAIADVRNDLDGLGRRVDAIKEATDKDRERGLQIQREIAENQRELIEMLTASSQAIQSSVHNVDVKVARLEERSDIADCFEKFGTRIENAVTLLTRNVK